MPFFFFSSASVNAVCRLFSEAEVSCHEDGLGVLVFFQEDPAGLPTRPAGDRGIAGGPWENQPVLEEP